MAQFISNRPITYVFLDQDTLGCAVCGQPATQFVKAQNGGEAVVTLTLPMCDEHYYRTMEEPEIMFRLASRPRIYNRAA